MSGSLILALFLISTPVGAQDGDLDFAREVLPILSNKCFICHGPHVDEKKQLRLDSYASATKDRKGTRAIDPHSPAKSEILTRLHDGADPMPPKDAEKQLTAEERNVLVRWVRQGGVPSATWTVS